MRRTVLGLVVVAVMLMPMPGMAAQGDNKAAISWWKALLTWVVQAAGLTASSTDQTATPSASSIIDPSG
jgi:hypothetical protein